VYTLVRRYIKTGIAFLFAGLLVGSWMLVRREIFGIWPDPYLVSAHAHAVLVGFVMFLILGVALWLFPRAPKEDRRYRPERAAAAYWILLFSTVSRFFAEAVRGAWGAPFLGWIVVFGVLARCWDWACTSGPCGPVSVLWVVICGRRRASGSSLASGKFPRPESMVCRFSGRSRERRSLQVHFAVPSTS
jgi:hypothetical protein